MSNLPPPGSHVHLIAVCGVGMASLAGLLKSQGYRVTGSDQNIYPPMSIYLAEIGIPVLPGYHAENLSDRPDLAIVGNAVSRTNPEAEVVLQRKIPFISFPQAIGQFLIGSRQSIVVAGTHGKTSTTALMAWLLSEAGMDPGFFVGGIPINFGGGWNPGKGNCVVLEGDEYDSAFFDKGPKFLHYRPHKVILTSVEFDHADIYRDLDHLKEAFRGLVELIPADGCLVVCSDYAAAREVAGAARCRRLFYGDDAEHWTATDIQIREGRMWFEPCYKGRSEGVAELKVAGRHSAKNALAAYALGREMGIERQSLLRGMATFSGVKRRQEIVGESRGVLIIDDFAHHPTAVRETISAVRSGYPGRRLWAIFEPRSQTSRRRIFAREFAEALAIADRVIVAALYQPEKIPAEDRLPPANVIEEINRLSGDERARYVEANAEIVPLVMREARVGDIVLVMSNGGFDGVQAKILQGLNQRGD